MAYGRFVGTPARNFFRTLRRIGAVEKICGDAAAGAGMRRPFSRRVSEGRPILSDRRLV